MPNLEMHNQRANKPRLRFRNISQPSVRNIIVFAGVLSIYVAVYLRDMIGGAFPGSPSLIMLSLGTMVLLFSGQIKISSLEVVAGFAFLVFTLINTAIAGTTSFSNYLIAPVIALVISKTARPTFVAFMICHALVSILIQAYEHFNGSYIFAVVEDGTVLDSALFSGNADIMRAKGLFQGPLSAVAFYILISLIYPRMWIITTGMAGAVLAYGRLGIVITFLLFSFRFLAKSKTIGRILVILLLASFLVMAPELISLPSFFTSAFDMSSPNNVARVQFWKENLLHYSNYSMINLIFGNLGYASRVIGSTENDFIRILMDTGVSGLLIYLLLLFGAFRKAIRIGHEKTFHLLVIIVAMLAFPLIQSLNATILYWVYIWGFFHGHESSKGQEI